mgnify:CR=1 FL=1
MEAIAQKLEEKVEILTGEIEQESDTKVRKEKRTERKKWKKPLKLIRKFFTSTSQIQGAE